MLNEGGEELELERRQLHLALADDDAPLRVVDLDEAVAVRLGHLRLAARAAEERLDPGEQLLPAERLRDVVVGARGETADALELLGPRCEHDHRHLGEVADPLERLVPVQLRHADVEEDEGGRRLVQLPQGRPAVGRLLDPVTRADEQLPEEDPDVLVVVDDEDSRPVIHTVFILAS